MVSASDQAFILELLDYQQEFNIKLITLSLILVYVIALKLWSDRTEQTSLFKALTKFVSKLLFWPFIVFMPLFTLLLFRGYTAGELWTVLFVLYGVVFGVIFVLWLVWGLEKILSMFGIDFDKLDFEDNRNL